MARNILKIIVIFVVGMVGGIFADQIIWSYFVEKPFFYEYQLAGLPVSLPSKNEITIQENVALQNAVEKIEKTVIGIRTKTGTGKTLSGSGLIITSDGLVVTLAELVPKGGDFTFFVDGKTSKCQILKRDLKENLALIKIEEKDLQTCGFADYEELKLGERVFLLGTIFKESGPLKMVNEGIVKFFTADFIRTNIFEKYTLKGSSLFNIRGELLGLNTIDSEGKVTAIPVSKIRAFIGF